MVCYAGVPTGDKVHDARRNERLAWNRILETMRDLADTPLGLRVELVRRRYETAKSVWWRAYLRLDQVRA